MEQAKYTVKNNKVQVLPQEATDTCPACGSLLVEYSNGLVTYAECNGCGYTETGEITRPEY